MLHVTLHDEGRIAVWTVDRPEAKNALDHATVDLLARALEDASKEKSLRAIVLTGAGDTFISGGDLRELRTATTTAAAERVTEMGHAICDAIGELHVPVIAALPGAAIGGGAELAVACDLRVADARARLCFKQAQMGVTTAWGTVPRLVALVGTSAASRMLFTAMDVHADEARALGLVDHVADDGTCVAVAVAWAKEIAKSAPLAVSGMKALVRAVTATPPCVRALERERFVATWLSEDHRQAVDGFFAGIAPTWTGR